MLETALLYLAFGAVAGVLSGLFGIGGGVVVVPFLVWQLAERAFPPDTIMIVAVATSLATIIVTSMSSVYSHHRRGAVDWGEVAGLTPGLLVGVGVGSIVAERLPVTVFKLFFTCFLLWVAISMLVRRETATSKPATAKPWVHGIAGLIIGGFSAILGIGGGTLTVPFLAKRLPMRNAVAISSACGIPIAVASTASYITLGWNNSVLPSECLGYVYLPGFLGIGASSVLFAPIGARWAHILKASKHRGLFACLLIGIAFKMAWPLIKPQG